jgi:hypothetical protein
MIEDGKGQRFLILINHSNSKKSVSVGAKLYTLGDSEIQYISMK